MIMNWTQESLTANHEYRRDQLRRLAGHRIQRPVEPVAEADQATERHPAHWWSRLRHGPSRPRAA